MPLPPEFPRDQGERRYDSIRQNSTHQPSHANITLLVACAMRCECAANYRTGRVLCISLSYFSQIARNASCCKHSSVITVHGKLAIVETCESRETLKATLSFSRICRHLINCGSRRARTAPYLHLSLSEDFLFLFYGSTVTFVL